MSVENLLLDAMDEDCVNKGDAVAEKKEEEYEQYRQYAEPVEPEPRYHTAAEEVYATVAERERHRLPKRNNIKRVRDPEYEATIANLRVRAVACTYCHSDSSIICDDRSGVYVCSACGTVCDGAGPDVVDYSDAVRTPAPVNSRRNYFKERLSQWDRREPPIPEEGLVDLRNAFHRLRNNPGAPLVSDVLSKAEVRAVVIEAGLRPKNCVEKWLTIRKELRKTIGLPDDCPHPSSDLQERMLEYFDVFVRAWSTYPELRQERTSLPNFNFIICNFLLMIDPAEYEKHAPWFGQVTSAKLAKLQIIWNTYCKKIGWPVYQAYYDKEGRLHRVEQKTYDVLKKVKAANAVPKKERKDRDIREFLR